MVNNKYQKAFTLIELLVVIAIIGVLSSVVLASLNSARAKSRDAIRLSTIAEIVKALEMYYDKNGKYPPIPCAGSVNMAPGCANSLVNWTTLGTDLAPWLGSLSLDPLGDNSHFYIYASNTGNNHSTYGLATFLEDSSSALSLGDGGYYTDAYEVGDQPVYCMEAYGGDPVSDWFRGLLGGGAKSPPPNDTVCRGGN